MARSSFEPEIRASIGTGKPGRVNTSPPRESPADMARDRQRGIKEGSPEDQRLDAEPQNQMKPMHMQTAPASDMPPNPAHAAMAASIAHAILQRK